MMLRCLPVLLLLSAPAAADVPEWRPAGAGGKSATALSVAYASLPSGSAFAMSRAAPKSGRPWMLHLPDGRRYAVEASGTVVHANGDVTYAGTVHGAGARYPVLLTVGTEASFGTWHTPSGRYRFEARGAEGWLLDTGHRLLSLEPADGGAVGDAARHAGGDDRHQAKAAAETVIDVMFLYSDGFAARYPGSAAVTRINHLVAIANQSMADSGVSLALRLVAAERTDYPDAGGANSVALNALAATLGGNAASFPGLAARRVSVGADLVTLIWPHDIETRGSCGIAFFPTGDPRFGANVVSDGFDSWSLCADDVYAHEVGHNLLAEHQDGANSGEAGFGTPFILPGRLHTVMGSFGSGHPDRYLGLSRFSNPSLRCGGLPCGLANVHDNARRLRELMGPVSAYVESRSALPAVAPPPSDPDVDGDGVRESADAFPHDARWSSDRDGDGVADPVDAFPDLAAESADTDGDAIGDNADGDDDGDGRPDATDAFPLDAAERDDADGDGVGDIADAFDADRSEWRDSDGDGIGDNTERDADGDGVPAFADGATMGEVDLLVTSAGTDRVLRFDGATGLYGGVEVADAHVPQALGNQSDLAWNPHQELLYALVGGGVRRYDRAGPASLGTFLAPNALGPRPPLASSFPAGLVLGADGTVAVADESSGLLTRHDAISGTQAPGGIFYAGPVFSLPARDVETADRRRAWAMEADGALHEIDLVTGVARESIVPRIGSFDQARSAADLAVAPDGSALFIADAAGNRVLRVEAADLTRGRVLVGGGAGGLQTPTGVAVGPDGLLYVSSSGNDRILRFDALTGGYVDVFSKAPPGVLDQPRDLLFVPKVRDRYPTDARRLFRPVPGNWYDPSRSGHGLELQRAGDSIGLLWYTYRSDGSPTWYLAPAQPLVGESWSAPLLRFSWDGMRATGVQVGTASLRFVDERHAEFSWTLPGGSGSEPIQLLQVGTSSETQFPTAAWYPPAESGWGLSVARQGEIAYAVAFVYDQAGQPTWVAGATTASPTRLVMSMSVFDGPTRCPGCSGDAPVTSTPAGELVFEIGDLGNARVDADFVAEGLDWQRTDAAFGRLTDTPTLPNDDPLP